MIRAAALLAVLLSACVPARTDNDLPTGPTRVETETGTVTILPLSDETREPPIRRTLVDLCGANSLSPFVGQHESVFFRFDFPDDTRFIGPGDAVTQDRRARRINFSIGGDGRVTRVWCG